MTLDPPKSSPLNFGKTIASFMGGSSPKHVSNMKKKQTNLLSFFASPGSKRSAEQSNIEHTSPSKKRGYDGDSLIASSSCYEFLSEPEECTGTMVVHPPSSPIPVCTSKTLDMNAFAFSEPEYAKLTADELQLCKGHPNLNMSSVGKLDDEDDEVLTTRECHEDRYQWLVKIRDAHGRDRDNPEYDPRTLQIPKSAWEKFTPFEKQFWEIKCKLFDTVVFFKKGKFYELYETDADIGSREFDLKMIDRVNMRLVGVPEASFEMWASRFVSAGYKIARVDQKETSIGKSIREKEGSGKADKIIRRELSCILTAGTLVEPTMIGTDDAPLCIAIKETVCGDSIEYGLAILDASTSSFQLCDFTDDKARYILETILIRLQPKEVILEKSKCSPETKKILKSLLPFIVLTEALSDKEFWGRSKIADELDAHNYYSLGWPEALRSAYEEGRPCFLAFGCLLWYLCELRLDIGIVSAGKVNKMVLNDYASRMILDGHTLLNLDIIPSSLRSSHSSFDDGRKGTLLGVIDHCCTPFGRRLLQSWLCHPLRNVDQIEQRLDFVEFFMNESLLAENIRKKLVMLPDLERSLNRIHCGSLKLKDYLKTLEAFEVVLQLRSLVLNYPKLVPGLEETILKIPDYSELLNFFANNFDQRVAHCDGTIVPLPGMSEEYDVAEHQFAQVRMELNNYLLQQEKVLGICGVKYRDIGKEIFQMEIPANVAVPKEYMLMSKTKTAKRYWTPRVKELVTQYQEWEERRLGRSLFLTLSYSVGILRTIYAQILKNFAAKSFIWNKVVEVLGQLDCLLSLYKASDLMSYPKCRPSFARSDRAAFCAKDLRYPCLSEEREAAFISNNVSLGTSDSDGGQNQRLILLTGPNMGGKSTLLRQTCLAVILAQVGCHVPASECHLAPVDRIFTRLGANDNIIAGQSTFMVELLDTARILREATPQSLIIIDELGRGTSTFDGMAIAHSTLLYLARVNQSIGMFATHYRPLAVDCAKEPFVACQYMSCALDPSSCKVTFLYKLVPGISPKSYGMNVAMMAGLPTDLIEEAELIAESFERPACRAGLPYSSDKSKHLISLIVSHLCSTCKKSKLGDLQS